MKKGKQVDLVLAADKTMIKAEGLSVVCIGDCRGRTVSEEKKHAHSQGALALVHAARACRAEKGHPLPENIKGKELGLHIRNRKGSAVRRALKEAGFIPENKIRYKWHVSDD